MKIKCGGRGICEGVSPHFSLPFLISFLSKVFNPSLSNCPESYVTPIFRSDIWTKTFDPPLLISSTKIIKYTKFYENQRRD